MQQSHKSLIISATRVQFHNSLYRLQLSFRFEAVPVEKQLPKQNAMTALSLNAVVQQVFDAAESESETTHENDDVVPDIGREEVVQSSTTRKRRSDPSQ